VVCVQCNGKRKEAKTIAVNRWQHVKHVAHESLTMPLWRSVTDLINTEMLILMSRINTRIKTSSKHRWLLSQFLAFDAFIFISHLLEGRQFKIIANFSPWSETSYLSFLNSKKL
jgi:hypothetical protein